MKFVSKEKLSKKARRELDNKNRLCWGAVNPVTRKAENKKTYNRKKVRKGFGVDSFAEPFLFCVIGLSFNPQQIIIKIY